MAQRSVSLILGRIMNLEPKEDANMSTLLENGLILDSKWEILGHIATGGKGELYLARQINLDRQVVVKTISSDLLMKCDEDREEIHTTINRFHREARAMAQVRHPNVVQVHDKDSTVIARKDTEIAVPYVVMEYVPGSTLRSTMPSMGIGENEQEIRDWVHNYFLPILDAIETIHKRGIVHRDIKPENVLMDGSNPKIADFGIAGGVRWQQLTGSHHVEGTISYMAPEQFLDLRETDVRGDVYSLGKILYEAVCGNMAESKTAVPLRTVFLPNPATPFLEGLDHIIQESTAEDKEERMPSVKVLRQRLEGLFDESVALVGPPTEPDVEFWTSSHFDAVKSPSFGVLLQASEKANREKEDWIREARIRGQRAFELRELNEKLEQEIAARTDKMIEGLRDRERIREMFGKYMSREIRDVLLATSASHEAETRDVTILFCDLRGFTSFVEMRSPQQVVEKLNQYYTEMVQAIEELGGLVLQFIGDEIEAVFGAPLDLEDHASRAVQAAMAMKQRLSDLNREWKAQGDDPFQHGIGIHTGDVVAASVGSPERLSYVMVGDAVNLASRIQNMTKDLGCDILISGETRRLLSEGITVEFVRTVQVRGKRDQTDLFKVL